MEVLILTTIISDYSPFLSSVPLCSTEKVNLNPYSSFFVNSNIGGDVENGPPNLTMFFVVKVEPEQTLIPPCTGSLFEILQYTRFPLCPFSLTFSESVRLLKVCCPPENSHNSSSSTFTELIKPVEKIHISFCTDDHLYPKRCVVWTHTLKLESVDFSFIARER